MRTKQTKGVKRLQAISQCKDYFFYSINRIRLTKDERDEIITNFEDLASLAENFSYSLEVYELPPKKQ